MQGEHLCEHLGSDEAMTFSQLQPVSMIKGCAWQIICDLFNLVIHHTDTGPLKLLGRCLMDPHGLRCSFAGLSTDHLPVAFPPLPALVCHDRHSTD